MAGRKGAHEELAFAAGAVPQGDLDALRATGMVANDAKAAGP